jgi:hypothetical protein
VDDASETVCHTIPLGGELSFINPLRLNEDVEVEMPAFSFIGDLQGVESTDPVTTYFSAAKTAKPIFELTEVRG